MIISRRIVLLGGPALALAGCFDKPCEERNPAQLAFLDGLRALARPALSSGNPLKIEEAAKQSIALADKVGVFTDWCGTLTRIEGTAQKVAGYLNTGAIAFADTVSCGSAGNCSAGGAFREHVLELARKHRGLTRVDALVVEHRIVETHRVETAHHGLLHVELDTGHDFLPFLTGG